MEAAATDAAGLSSARKRRLSSRLPPPPPTTTANSSPSKKTAQKNGASRRNQANQAAHLHARLVVPAAPPEDKTGPWKARLEQLLPQLPMPCPELRVIRGVGEGTFSTVFLVRKIQTPLSKPGKVEQYAIKHLVPTACPDRVLTEVECLRMAGGESNVLPLIFAHRIHGDVLLAMPYVEASKFPDVIRRATANEVRLYIKNLLLALRHIHSFGIIHRDIKPANFLYDPAKKKFGLVDFGLAQKGDAVPLTAATSTSENKGIKCKRKLDDRDYCGNSHQKPVEKGQPLAKRLRYSPRKSQAAAASLAARSVLEDTTLKQVNSAAPAAASGAASTGNKKSSPRKKSNMGTPSKAAAIIITEQIKQEFELRRSPRKHAGSPATPTAMAKPVGYSTLKISGNAILSPKDPSPQHVPHPQANSSLNSSLSRTNSFTMLDPASGVPCSDGTPRTLAASLTSRASNRHHGYNPFLPLVHVGPAGAAAALGSPTGPALANNANDQQQLHIGNDPSKGCTGLSNQATASQESTDSQSSQGSSKSAASSCSCYGQPKVCTLCLARKSQKAARAGTPGFRPPEVLLKVEHQSTAVDIWAAGVIMMCMLSRTYPFFRAQDDYQALAEITALFGTDPLEKLAQSYGKLLMVSDRRQPLPLGLVCLQLAQRQPKPEQSSSAACSGALKPPPPYTESPGFISPQTDLAVDLLERLLTLCHKDRLTADQALKHPYFKES